MIRFMKQALIALFVTICALLPAAARSYAADVASAEEVLEPDSAKECAICHYDWVDTFFTEHRGTELVPLPARSPTADAEMCFSCHDGSTVDSRKHVFNDRQHQVGVTPSDKITVPEKFPLDEQGKMTCATCHSAHGVSTEPGIEKTIFLRTSNNNSRMCRMCHEGKEAGPESGHHPVDETALTVSKEIYDYGGYTGDAPDQVICETCHMAHGGFTDKRLVLPVDRPGRYPVLCEACHGKTPGRSETRSMNRFSHSVDVMPDSAQIPKAWESGTAVRLGMRGEVVCVTCHVTHEAPVKESLLQTSNAQNSMCLQCHESQYELIANTRHDMSRMAPEAQNLKGETAAESGPCGVCHLMHEGVGPFMWARRWQGKEEPAVGVCISCHDEGKCASDTPLPETGHPVGVTPEAGSADMDFPLYSSTGKRSAQGAVYCSSCHNSHQWDPADPGDKGETDAPGTINNSFLRTSHEQSALCAGCHKEEAAVSGTDHDLSRSAPEEKNIHGQAPAESGVCGSCHVAHGGNALLMWARAFGQPENMSPMEQVCFDCHREGACGGEKVTGEHSHPVNADLSDDQYPEDLPLFSPEGKKRERGRVFCSTCHDAHRWSPSDPEITGDEGGPADSFLRISAAGSSRLCAECHPGQSLVRGTDHDLSVSAPDAENARGAVPEESGLCGACHGAHHAQQKSFLWNREIGPAVLSGWKEDFADKGGIMIGLCTDCHQPGGCAEDAVPEYGLHPGRLYMASLERSGADMGQKALEKHMKAFPVYAADGEKSAAGDIVCATCHDGHIWDSACPAQGPGEERDGNATNSFLRKDISFGFCSSCHGEEALFRFKYFHSHKREMFASEKEQERDD